jgi:hypothetical protein
MILGTLTSSFPQKRESRLFWIPVVTGMTMIFLLAVPAFSADIPLFRGDDKIEMKDGTVIEGRIVAKNSVQLYVDIGEKEPKRIDMSDIKTIHFGPEVKTQIIPRPSASPTPSSEPGLKIQI